MNGKSEKWLYFFNILVSRLVNGGKRPERVKPESILIVKWDEIGDMATCTHVFQLLRKRFPNAEIDLITKPHSAGLVKNDPHLNHIYTDLNSWNKPYDLHIELRGTWKSLFRIFRYFPRYRLDRGLVRYKQRGQQPHEATTNYRIVEPVLGGIKNELPALIVGAEPKNTVAEWLKKEGIEGRFAVFHAGARSMLRRWPADRFAHLADWLKGEHQMAVVFTGSSDEMELMQSIQGQMKSNSTIFMGELETLPALIDACSLYVGNESGPLQIADALKKPVLGIFGPGVKDVFYPFQSPNSRVLHHILECNPCDQVHCVRPENPCISLVSKEDAKAAISAMLKSD